MTNTVLIKRSSTPGAVPSSGVLTAGELAINYADGKLYYLGSGGAVTQIAGNSSMTYSGNVTAGNLITVGDVSAATISTTGNASIGGDLIVNGNIAYINVTTLDIEDPIIGVGRGPNGSPLLNDDNKDRGIDLWYYDTSEKQAFIGWDDSTGKLFAATNVNINNELVTVNNYGTFVVGDLEASGVSAVGNIAANYFIGNGSQLTGISANAFATISVAGQSNVVANSSGLLNFADGTGVTITTDAATGTITFAASGSSGSIFASGGSMGLITEIVLSAEDLGLITDLVATSYDLGTVTTGGLVWPEQFKLPEFTVGTMPTPSPAGLMIYVSNATGGSIPAFSDGSNWRRVDDRNVVT